MNPKGCSWGKKGTPESRRQGLKVTWVVLNPTKLCVCFLEIPKFCENSCFCYFSVVFREHLVPSLLLWVNLCSPSNLSLDIMAAGVTMCVDEALPQSFWGDTAGHLRLGS